MGGGFLRKEMDAMKRRGAALLALLIAAVTVLSSVPQLPEVQAAGSSYLALAPVNSKGMPAGGKKQVIWSSEDGTRNKVEGLSYNKKTNTLTLNNFVHPKNVIMAVRMGSDFRIRLKGTNKVQGVFAYSYSSGKATGLKFTGTGRLIANKNKRSKFAIHSHSAGRKVKIYFTSKVNIKAFSKKNNKYSYAVFNDKTKLKKNGITAKGGFPSKKGYPSNVVAKWKKGKGYSFYWCYDIFIWKYPAAKELKLNY